MTAAPGRQQPDEVETRVDYLCLGHPAWPGNLTMPTPERAQGWLDDHRNDGHPLRVVKRTTIREPFRPAAPSAQPEEGCEHIAFVHDDGRGPCLVIGCRCPGTASHAGRAGVPVPPPGCLQGLDCTADGYHDRFCTYAGRRTNNYTAQPVRDTGEGRR